MHKITTSTVCFNMGRDIRRLKNKRLIFIEESFVFFQSQTDSEVTSAKIKSDNPVSMATCEQRGESEREMIEPRDAALQDNMLSG